MKWDDKFKFIHDVRNAVRENPEWFRDALNAMVDGMQDSLYELRERQIDTEVIASALFTLIGKKCTKANEEFIVNLIKSKAEKLKGKDATRLSEEIINKLGDTK